MPKHEMCMQQQEEGKRKTANEIDMGGWREWNGNTRVHSSAKPREIFNAHSFRIDVLFLRTRCSFTSFAWNSFYCEIIFRSARTFSSMRKSASFQFQSLCFLFGVMCMWKKTHIYGISIQWLFDARPHHHRFDFRFSLMMMLRWHARFKNASLRQSVTDLFIRISFIASALHFVCVFLLFQFSSICHCFR